MIAYPVCFVAISLLACFVAYITAAICAETDIRDDHGPGQLTWVWVTVPSAARHIEAPLCPPMHHLPLRVEVEEVGRPLLYGPAPEWARGVVDRVAA